MLASPLRTYPLPATFRVRGYKQPLGLLQHQVAPPGPAWYDSYVSSIHHSGFISATSALPVSGPLLRHSSTNYKAPPPRSFSPSLASHPPMRIIHNPPCPARPRRSLASRQYQAPQSRTSMRSLPLLFRTRPTCNNNDMRPKVRGLYLTSP